MQRSDRKANQSQQPVTSARRDDAQDASIAALQAVKPLAIGSATLVAGTVTVALATIGASSTVLTSPIVVSAKPGFLGYVIVPGVSFTITSSNVLDASTVAFVVWP